MNLNTSPEKPYVFSFAIIKPWFMVSKAFERFINNAETLFPLSMALCHFSNITTKEYYVPCDFLKLVM